MVDRKEYNQSAGIWEIAETDRGVSRMARKPGYEVTTECMGAFMAESPGQVWAHVTESDAESIAHSMPWEIEVTCSKPVATRTLVFCSSCSFSTAELIALWNQTVAA